MAPTPPPTAAPIPAPRPPPAIAPITAPVPAPTRPPPIARSAGLYGSAKAVAANTSPTPTTLAKVDCFLIRFLPRATPMLQGKQLTYRAVPVSGRPGESPHDMQQHHQEAVGEIPAHPGPL